ncbi:MAG: polyprenyl synthetase family protein [Chloroflexi bacterium]|nr:polyprenyl synthetase family protein [Chloroflexota bacterium]
MDIYTRTFDEFSNIPVIDAWAEVRDLFQRVASGRPRHWLLPLRACEAVGGSEEQSLPALVAVACSHIGIVLVDDMLDADPRGEHLRVGAPSAANMASALQSAALASIAHCDLPSESKLIALESVNEMFLSTTLGQYWDIQPVKDEEGYWRVARTKSSPFFGAALQIGTLMGGASAGLAGQIKRLGGLYGEMIQIHDDLNDTMEVPANPDWVGRSPLPILFARLVEHPLRDRFVELCPNAGINPGALEEAQEILIQCGAVSYCVYQLLSRHRAATETLSALPLARRESLTSLFEDVVMPVRKLFEAVGEAPANLSAFEMMAEAG